MQIRSLPAAAGLAGLLVIGGASLALAQEDTTDTPTEDATTEEDSATESDTESTRPDRGDCHDDEDATSETETTSV